MKKFLVGGAVRDKILGKEINDFDYLVFDCSEETLLSMGFQLVKKDIKVFLDPKTGDQYAFPRKETKTGKKYTDFIFEYNNVSLQEDLFRRDFTINAMAMGEDNVIVDPFGGQKDLENKILRHVSDKFSEDPLRVIRGFRFASNLDLEIAPETMTLFNSLKSELKHVSNGRVFLELTKVNDLRKFLSLLNRYGFLDTLFPNAEVGEDSFALDMENILIYLYRKSSLSNKDMFYFYGFNKSLVDKVFQLSNNELNFDLLFKKLKIDQLDANLLIVKDYFLFRGDDSSRLVPMIEKMKEISTDQLGLTLSGKALGIEIYRLKEEIYKSLI